ncbi:MAG: hypothetical protein RIS42_58 [Bacteroidota bacterium]|jgi:hypothetical protein
MAFVGSAQRKHYKNQINGTLKEKINIEIVVEVPVKSPSTHTPKYQPFLPNIIVVDTVKKTINNASYKQHGGRPN